MAHNKLRILSRGLFMMLGVFSLGLATTSCNEKEEEKVSEDYISTQSVAVTAFSLSPDLKIMKNLDSVYFSIDLEHGVIFNADSLPKGANITKLIPKISYPSSVTSATIEMKGGTHREGVSNYYSNANDTIDFTGDVTLTLGADNDKITKTYSLKVNVHRQDPDTIYWERMAQTDLPSRNTGPTAQKTIMTADRLLSLIEESDGSFTIATTDDIFSGQWEKNSFSPGFTPIIETLRALDNNYIAVLSDNGNLMISSDGNSWDTADTGWSQIIGLYGETLLGISTTTTSAVMKSWPSGTYPEMTLPADFPLSGFTTPVEFNNRWTPDPTIVIFGGYPYSTDGKSPAWAFDGSQWVNIAENALPALSGMSVVKYYSYLNSASNGLLKEFEVYLAFGGKDRDGNVNNTIYVTYDHGINWQKAQEYTQLPESVQAGYMVDVLSIGSTMESNLSNRWEKTAKRKLPFTIDGDLIKWECPYLFLFGGYDAESNLNPKIRSGVLERLTFEPLF